MNLAQTSRKAKRKIKLKEYAIGYLFASPVILGIIIYTYVPTFQALIYSFFDYDGFYTMDYVGFKNYHTALFIDPDTWIVVKNTFTYALITVPLNLVLGYLVALLVNTKAKGIGIFRTFIYLPLIIPMVASGLLWLDIFDTSSNGVMNNILAFFNIPAQTFFSKAESSMATLILTTVWSVGGSMVLWLSQFKSIPAELYESAYLDGANYVQKTLKITLPLSTPIIFYNLITGIIGALQISSTLIIGGVSGKGMDNSLYFISAKIYNESFRGAFRLGYASAISMMLFLVIGLLTLIVFLTSKKWVYYQGD